ncbi:hypothetical protein RM51_10800 [Chryseobacterium taiwanense]|uniref:Uncharacterized protein n=1 Tax=Chryseobacterium taiwanense TaxID=363331 RepID=A0A0B4CN35_9FLAO|nr:hypothetical protein RM51_10800 [Chryseobacterium taiwanense]
MINIKNLLLLAFCFFNTAIFAQQQYILALSKGEKKLVVMDYTTLEVIKKIPVGDDPHEIVTNSDGTRAYTQFRL